MNFLIPWCISIFYGCSWNKKKKKKTFAECKIVLQKGMKKHYSWWRWLILTVFVFQYCSVGKVKKKKKFDIYTRCVQYFSFFFFCWWWWPNARDVIIYSGSRVIINVFPSKKKRKRKFKKKTRGYISFVWSRIRRKTIKTHDRQKGKLFLFDCWF